MWERGQRLEAHHQFLDSISRLIITGDLATTRVVSDDVMAEFRENAFGVISAFNRVELVCGPRSYAAAAGIMDLANADLADPTKRVSAVEKIGKASQLYREVAQAELIG